jgi:chlorobactene glucosyltransferase
MGWWLEVIGCGLYVLLGPLLFGFMILSMFEGRRRMTVLFNAPPLPDPAPRVTVMIPARNEAANIEKCVTSVLGQDYPNLRVVVANDRSTDATGEILERLAANDARLRVVHLSDADFMTGWGGKSSTLHNAYEKGVKIGGETDSISQSFLLGLDADVRLTRSDAISACVRAAIKHRAAIFSLLPALESQSFFEELVIPLTGMLSSSINAVALTNVDSFKRIAYANGQCLLIRREVYDAIGGHTKVGKIVAEDVALAYLVKGSGQRVRLAWGANLCAIRMYDSLSAVYRGLSRIISVSRDGRIWPMVVGIAFLLLCLFSIVPAGIFTAWRFTHPITTLGKWGWLTAVVSHYLTIVVQLGLTYAWSKNRWWIALLFPLGGAIALAIFVRALRQAITGKFEWRGVNYSLKSSSPTP